MKISFGFVLCMVSVFFTVAFPAAVGAAPARDGGVSFNTVEGKEWLLSEFKIADTAIRIDRLKLEADSMGGFFTVRFGGSEVGSENRASGVGAPNRYFAPYSTGANRSLGIGSPAGTLMAAFREPDNLTERGFFGYLSKVSRWDIDGNRLELYSSNNAGVEVILIFILK